MSPDVITREIRTFIVSNFLMGEPADSLNDDDLLLEGGIVDSGSVVTLVCYLEEQFGIQIRDQDLFAENFATVERIVAFVTRRQTEGMA